MDPALRRSLFVNGFDPDSVYPGVLLGPRPESYHFYRTEDGAFEYFYVAIGGPVPESTTDDLVVALVELPGGQTIRAPIAVLDPQRPRIGIADADQWVDRALVLLRLLGEEAARATPWTAPLCSRSTSIACLWAVLRTQGQRLLGQYSPLRTNTLATLVGRPDHPTAWGEQGRAMIQQVRADLTEITAHQVASPSDQSATESLLLSAMTITPLPGAEIAQRAKVPYNSNTRSALSSLVKQKKCRLKKGKGGGYFVPMSPVS